MNKSEKYTPEFLEQVISFGILAYSVDKIIDLTEPENPEQFRLDFDTPGSQIHKAYRKGKTTGEYTLDKKLYDIAANDTNANILLTQRKEKQKVTDKIYEKFGI